MKITKKGRDPKGRLWRGTCSACDAEAEATEAEMTNITYDQREGGSLSWEKCPQCGAGVWFYPVSGGDDE